MAIDAKRKTQKRDDATKPRKKSKQASSSSPSTKKGQQSSSSSGYQKQRKHADIVTGAKALWNQLRQKKNTKEQTRELMDKLIPLIKGKVKEIALQHDAARVVQAALQFGTLEERRSVVKELTADPGTLAELSKSQYAHFVVLKVIQYGHQDNEICLPLIIKNFKGHMSKLAVHAVGSRVVEALFTTIHPLSKLSSLKLEFYGPHMILFGASLFNKDNKQQNSSITLAYCIQQAPEHKKAALEHVKNLVYKGMEKTLYALEFFQQLLQEYCEAVIDGSGNEVRSLLANSSVNNSNPCEHAIHLLSTRAGVRAVCELVAYGTAKDRKSILKSLKGYAKSGLLHPQAYLVYLQLIQLTDDTVLVHKQMLQELLTVAKDDDKAEGDDPTSPLLELALSERAVKLFMMVLLLNDKNNGSDSKESKNESKTSTMSLSKLLDPYELSVLTPGKVPTVTEADGTAVPTSKKEASLKQKELFKYLQKPLLDLCTQHTTELLMSRSGSMLLRQVYLSLGEAAPQAVQAMLEQVIIACEAPLSNEDGDNDGADEQKQSQEYELLGDTVGHWSIKNLLLADLGRAEGDDDTPSFSNAFLEAFGPKLTKVALSHGNRSAFVVAALAQVQPVKKLLDVKELQKHVRKKSEGNGGAGKSNAGLTALLKQLDA